MGRTYFLGLVTFYLCFRATMCRGQFPMSPNPASERGVEILKSYKKNPNVLSLAKQRYKAVHSLEMHFNNRIASAGSSGIKILFPELKSDRFYILLENSTLDGGESQWRFMCYVINKSKVYRKWSIKVVNISGRHHLDDSSNTLTEYLTTRGCMPDNTTPKSIWSELKREAKYSIYNLDSIVEEFYAWSSQWPNHSKRRSDIWSSFDIEFDPFTRVKLTKADSATGEIHGIDRFFKKYGYPPSREEMTSMIKTGGRH